MLLQEVTETANHLSQQELDAALASLDAFSHVAFTSRNGVAGVLSRLAARRGAADGSCVMRLLGSAPNASHDPGTSTCYGRAMIDLVVVLSARPTCCCSFDSEANNSEASRTQVLVCVVIRSRVAPQVAARRMRPLHWAEAAPRSGPSAQTRRPSRPLVSALCTFLQR